MAGQARPPLLLSDVVLPGGTDGVKLAETASVPWRRGLAAEGLTLLARPHSRAELSRRLYETLPGTRPGLSETQA